MPPEQPTGDKSLLDKPLHHLTEDDIAQITREDCRRYLKEKGMRRPSWNKSQAIQQVIMMKRLFEGTPDSDAGSQRRLRFSRPNNSSSSKSAIPESAPKGTGGGAQNSVSPEESTPHRRKDPEEPDSIGGVSGPLASANDEYDLPRISGLSDFPVGQMTIFYCGKVNVYDDMPADKAREIMNIAASPLQFTEEQLGEGTTLLQPLPSLPKAAGPKGLPSSAVVISPTPPRVKMSDNTLMLGEENNMVCEEAQVEGQSNRKALVQRYLEKRKDRFKSKRTTGTASCESLDIYVNHQMGNQMPRTDTCSKPQVVEPSTPGKCSSVENDSVKNVCLSSGLSSKGT